MSQTTQRLCPFCEEPQDSRGLYAHVMNSDDEVHGEQGSVPENFNPREAPVMTDDEEVIETDLDSEYKNRLLMCHQCGTMAKGRRGMAIHLSKAAGDELHPPGISVSDGEYTEIPADEDWNPMVDQSELSQLHDEITQGIEEFELYGQEQPADAETADAKPEGESPTLTRTISDAELQELIDRAVIPQEATKTEQVAALLNQVNELYDRPEAVKEVVNCSTTTFYEGRKMYDNNAAPDMETPMGERTTRVEDIAWEAPEGDSVIIGGEPYVPVSVVKDLVRKVNDASSTLNEVSSEGAQLVIKNQ